MYKELTPEEIEAGQRVTVPIPQYTKENPLVASYQAQQIAVNYHLPRRGALLVERVLLLEDTVRVLKQIVEALRVSVTARPASTEPQSVAVSTRELPGGDARDRFKRRAD